MEHRQRNTSRSSERQEPKLLYYVNGYKKGELYLDFIHVNIGSVTHTALGGETVVRVLGTVAGEDLHGAIVHANAEVGLEDGLAWEDEIKDA